MKLRYKATAALAAVLTALSLAGCSDTPAADDGSAGDGGSVTIGVIQYAVHASLDNCYDGLIEGLAEAGYKEGENLTIDFQNAQSQVTTADQLAQNMAAKNYDMIIGIATPAAMSAYGATQGTDIPTIFCAVSDPVGAGLVSSLDAPGGNCTGTSDLLNLEAQLKLIRAVQPDAKTIGILYTTNEANSVSHLKKIKELAPEYGFEIVEQGVQSGADVPQAAAALAAKVDCINNFTDNNVVDNLTSVLAKAEEAGIPVYGSEIEQVRKGCIASESLDYVALGRETGKLAAQVLDGANPGETPVVQVMDSTPVINPDVFTALGLTIPEDYASAEEVTG
ncbi:MAG TPA: ABC transporter substrate-binding protein [Firmicutes bacterium]|nr:ABC transporter substrate-binding protein [Bacillota bacterium]